MLRPSPPRPSRALPIVLLAALGALAAACASAPALTATAITPTPPAAVTSAATATTATPSATPSPTPPAEPSATPTATPSATPTSTPTKTPAPVASTPPAATPAASTPEPASTPAPAFPVTIDPPFVPRGETILVRAVGAAAGTVQVGGRAVPMLADTTGAWAVVGVGLYADLGANTVRVTAQDAQGAPMGTVAARYTVVNPQRPVDYLTTTEETAAILTPEAAATETRLRAEQFASFDAIPAWRTAFRHPVLNFVVSTEFGSGRSINGGPVGDFHSGEDLAADAGVEVTSAAPGRVSWVGAMPIRGNTVIVDHGGGVKTGYHHLLDTSVVVGQVVPAGALLGHLGSTGFSTGPHLHWELTIFGVNVDPETWVTLGFPR